MKNIEKEVQHLIQLAKDWRTFASDFPESHGWDFERRSEDIEVRCYFAVNSDHTAVDFYMNRGKIQIGFHHPAKIQVDAHLFGCFSDIIAKGTLLLEKCKAEHNKLTKAELKAEKEAKRRHLEEELRKLKSE